MTQNMQYPDHNPISKQSMVKPPLRSINRLLIANRGEIACRIIKTARSLGIETVAIYSDVDQNAQHVQQADLSYRLGGDRPDNSYLVIDKIIEAAIATNADAIHPGYGFLAENSHFAKAIEKAGLIFIGPSVHAIEAMGSKSAAKSLMETAGVPLIPGYHGTDQDYETFRKAAIEIGYPVLLKASSGGGGRGMQIVKKEANLKMALESAQRESQSAFGDATMLLEKYIVQPRHVEIQIFADQHNNCIYLNERDCSIQRRHQKVIEEAPAPGMTPELRQKMGEAAVRAAQSIHYVGAGTVEFLLDARGEFFFMEMNTRLQVEHPITEWITQQDLVAWQIHIAQGANLPLTQADVPLYGHAIEVRIYAEDPDHDFMPASGLLSLYREPKQGLGRRVDSGVIEGDHISPFYDPMISKLSAWGVNREEARHRLLAMIDETHIAGIRTNLPFLKRILAHDAFTSAELDTNFIPKHADDLFFDPNRDLPASFWHLAAATWALSEPKRQRVDDPHSFWGSSIGWRALLPQRYTLNLQIDETQKNLTLSEKELSGLSWKDHQLTVQKDNICERYSAIRKKDSLYLTWNDEIHHITLVDFIAQAKRAELPEGGLMAPLNGNIVRILVETGQKVVEGEMLVVLEAMKMEHTILAPHSGTVTDIFCHEGEMVNDGTILIELTTELKEHKA